jgi:hypothetical protein
MLEMFTMNAKITFNLTWKISSNSTMFAIGLYQADSAVTG